MPMMRTITLDESAMAHLAQALAKVLTAPTVIYLDGDLGAGKTTFCRALIRQLGYQGAVKSPTYTIVEPYQWPELQLYHFDLYRLVEPEELEYLGIDDYFHNQAVCLIEWPERGAGILPGADIKLILQIVEQQRVIEICALTEGGRQLLAQWRDESAPLWSKACDSSNGS